MSVTFDVGQWENNPKFGRVLGWVEGASELNVSNQSAAVILSALGINPNDEGWVGTISVQQVRQAADLLEENLVNVQHSSVETGKGGCTIINCGTSMDRIRGWCAGLRKVADDAELYETYIVRWG